MIDTLISRDIEKQRLFETEKQILKELSFKQIYNDLFIFHDKDKTLYIDYRNNTRRIYAYDFFKKPVNRKSLHIYHIYKNKLNTKLYIYKNKDFIKSLTNI